LRIVLSITAVLGVFYIFTKRNNPGFLGVVLILFAILYNPIIPVILGPGTKGWWVFLNLIFFVALILTFYIEEFEAAALKKEEKKRQVDLKINELNVEVSNKNKELKTLPKLQFYQWVKSYVFHYCIIVAIIYLYGIFFPSEFSLSSSLWISGCFSILTTSIYLYFSDINRKSIKARQEIKGLESEISSLKESDYSEIFIGIIICGYIAYAGYNFYQKNNSKVEAIETKAPNEVNRNSGIFARTPNEVNRNSGIFARTPNEVNRNSGGRLMRLIVIQVYLLGRLMRLIVIQVYLLGRLMRLIVIHMNL